MKDDFGRNIEGYWKGINPKEKKYPMPVPNVLSAEEAKDIYDLIHEKEKKASKTVYRGMANSRIEPEVYVGAAEFSLDNWIWPDGYAKHYVLKHRVKPSDNFLKFIGYDASTISRNNFS